MLAFLQDAEYEGVEVLIAGLVLAEGSFFGNGSLSGKFSFIHLAMELTLHVPHAAC